MVPGLNQPMPPPGALWTCAGNVSRAIAMIDQPVSRRAATIAAAKPFELLFEFFNELDYAERLQRPGVIDLTFGDPHEMPSHAYVDSLAASLTP